MTLRVELVDSLPGFAALMSEWNAALARSDRASIFLTHEWLSGSWSFLAPGRELRILVVRDGKRFVGALPLALEKQRWRGLPLRCLVFLTDPVTGNVRSDLLVDTDPDHAVSALGGFLHATRREWDMCVLNSMQVDSLLAMRYDTFREAARLHAQPLEEYWRLHYLPVKGDWKDYLQSHTGHLRAHLRRERAKLERLGRVSCEFTEEPGAVLAAVEIFFMLERTSAKHRRGDYTPLDERLKTYLRVQFRGLAGARFALVATLRLDGVPIASILAARYGDAIHTLNDVFDANFAKAYPGHYLRGEIIRYAWQAGYRMVDFNGYGSHLQRWRTIPRSCYRAVFYSSSAYGGFLFACKNRIIPILRRVVPSHWLSPPPLVRPGDRGLESES